MMINIITIKQIARQSSTEMEQKDKGATYRSKYQMITNSTLCSHVICIAIV